MIKDIKPKSEIEKLEDGAISARRVGCYDVANFLQEVANSIREGVRPVAGLFKGLC